MSTLNERISTLSSKLDETKIKLQTIVEQNLRIRTRFGITNMEEFESGAEDIKVHDENSLIIEKKVQDHIKQEMNLIS